jgi:hypothetical protein
VVVSAAGRDDDCNEATRRHEDSGHADRNGEYGDYGGTMNTRTVIGYVGGQA